MNGKFFKALAVVAALLAIAGLFMPQVGDRLSPFAYQTKVYLTSGGDKMVVASGGEIEAQSGATVDFQSGATVGLDTTTFGGGFGSTGVTISTAGAVQADGLIFTGSTLGATGAITTASRVTADNMVCTNAATFGGGFGSTGATISTAGVVQADGASFFGSTLGATGVISTAGGVLLPNGAVGTPAWSFTGDTDNGAYYIGENKWALAVGGSKRLEFDISGLNLSGGQFNVPDGTAAAPIMRFTDDINTGFYRVTTDTIGLTAGGALHFSVSNTETTIGGNAVVTGTLDLQGGDLTLQNDETVSNASNGVVQIGGFLALTEGAVQVMTYGCTLTPVASFQPITSTAAITNVVIANGTVAGQIVVISNENAADDITILESGSQLAAGGDILLDGGNWDLVTLLWDGARWIRWSFGDN